MAAEEPGEMNYPELTAPLRVLTRKGTRFTWTAEHQEHFDLIKARLCSDRVMVPYDPERKTRLYTDGGPEGCQGTVAQAYMHPTLGEQWRPVAHTARAWIEPEKRYSQIEKESNALQAGILSNKTYLLGRQFEAMVDHKPLLPLYNSPRRPKQMRVDRHRMKLTAYDFTVGHVAGSKMPCDYGSRRGCPKARRYSEEDMEKYGVEDDREIYVNWVEEQLPAAITMDILREATSKDNKLKMLMADIEAGECRKGLTRFTQVFDELKVEDGVVLRGDQLVIPDELQALAVELAHEGHALGYMKTLGLLRETCWFPGMGEMVRQYVETCKACLAAVPGTQQEPLHPTELPDRPWQHIHGDYKGPIGGKYYLHTFIDQYTKYPVVAVCTSTNWEQMEPMLENALGMFGNVESLTTDNGPPYNSHKFAVFAKKMGFRHRKCTPENPAANGFVEAFQKVLVKLVHTAVIEKKDPKKVLQTYLRQYRAAPHKSIGNKSPYEMMFNRKMMTKLPYKETKRNPNLDAEVRRKHGEEKAKQKAYTDSRRRAKEKEIGPGDQVLIQRRKTTLKSPWDPEPYEVEQVKGSMVIARRGEAVTARAKNRVKVLKARPANLETKGPARRKHAEEEEDLEVDMSTIRRMADAEEEDGQGAAEEQELPDLPSSDEEERGGQGAREVADLGDALTRGNYWKPEALMRRSKPPQRYGDEREQEEERAARVEDELVPEEGQETRSNTPGTSPEATFHGDDALAHFRQDDGSLNVARLELLNPDWSGVDEPEEVRFEPALSPRRRRRRFHAEGSK
jgi:hypothetical protein